MNRVMVDPRIMDRLAQAFRSVVTIGVPRVSTMRTGHPELDIALADLRAAIDSASRESEDSITDHGRAVSDAERIYLETESALTQIEGRI